MNASLCYDYTFYRRYHFGCGVVKVVVVKVVVVKLAQGGGGDKGSGGLGDGCGGSDVGHLTSG